MLFAMAVLGRNMQLLVCGGYSNAECTASCEFMANGTWIDFPSLPTAVDGAAMVMLAGVPLVCGGADNSSNVVDEHTLLHPYRT